MGGGGEGYHSKAHLKQPFGSKALSKQFYNIKMKWLLAHALTQDVIIIITGVYGFKERNLLNILNEWRWYISDYIGIKIRHLHHGDLRHQLLLVDGNR